MNQKSEHFTIGRIAKAAGVNIETIRHYQRKELIVEPKKPTEGFRYYPASVIDEIRFIKRAQQLGFSLNEIKQLLFLGNQHCNDIQQLAIEKRTLIERQIEGLLTIKTVLDELISSCNDENSDSHCAFLETLNQKGFMTD